LVSLLNKKVPFRHCEKWDNAGFIAGDISGEITGVAAALDICDETLDYALKNKCNVIIAHHPLIFNQLRNLRADDYTGSLLIKLIKTGVSLIVLHTNFDKSIYNQSYNVAAKLGLQNIKPLAVTDSEYLYKIAVFVPPENCAALKNALCEAGAGIIGNYSQCAYMTEGAGEFMGGAASNPAAGKPLILERTKEIKLEMVFNEGLLNDVTGALIKNHPYEEPAYDIFQLKNTCKTYGYGVYGELAEKAPADKIINKLKKIMLAAGVPIFTAAGRRPEFIKKVAMVNGSGFDFYKNALDKKCDLFITGDISYHRALELKASGLYTIDCSHFATEINFGECLSKLISEIETEEKCGLNYKYSEKIQKNPLEIV
jgi:dinuclear metal center YbgI/SA1388 family protein